MEPGQSFIMSCLFWVFGFLLFWRVPFLKPSLRDDPGDFSGITVSVIIPARNEEGNLALLLESLGRQSQPPDEILVVDDRSTDRTAEVAAARGAKLVVPPELPPGWVGKGWACWTGANAARGDLFVFLDADTVLGPDALRRLILEWRKRGGLISVQPFHTMKKTYERLSAFFNILLFMNMNLASIFSRWVNPPGAFGPCLVCGRKDYFSVGGHQTVKAKVLEDIFLGKKFLAHNLPVRCFAGKGTISFRMYPGGLGQLVEGWTKNFASGAVSVHLVPAVLSSVWIAGGLSAVTNIVKGAVGKNDAFFLVGGALYALFAVQILVFLGKLGNFGPAPALLYPLPLLFFIFVLLRSAFSTFVLGRVNWKGRQINLRRKGGRG